MKKLIALLFVLVGCSQPMPTAQEIVDQAIHVSGLNKLKKAEVSFSFRDKDYVYQMNQGKYTYTRLQYDSAGNEIKDMLTNDGLKRYFNGVEIQITDEKRTSYASSVNSVIYFAFLPLWLNDAAVNKTNLGQAVINGKKYYKIKVTFDQDGGGEDYEDVFVYWFDITDYSMDYLGYSYQEKEGSGLRFRVAINSRIINGITIQDYQNYKPEPGLKLTTEDLDTAYENEQLTLLSLIEIENVMVKTPK